MSRCLTSRAFSSMNWRRGSTTSPMASMSPGQRYGLKSLSVRPGMKSKCFRLPVATPSPRLRAVAAIKTSVVPGCLDSTNRSINCLAVSVTLSVSGRTSAKRSATIRPASRSSPAFRHPCRSSRYETAERFRSESGTVSTKSAAAGCFLRNQIKISVSKIKAGTGVFGSCAAKLPHSSCLPGPPTCRRRGGPQPA